MSDSVWLSILKLFTVAQFFIVKDAGKKFDDSNWIYFYEILLLTATMKSLKIKFSLFPMEISFLPVGWCVEVNAFLVPVIAANESVRMLRMCVRKRGTWLRLCLLLNITFTCAAITGKFFSFSPCMLCDSMNIWRIWLHVMIQFIMLLLSVTYLFALFCLSLCVPKYFEWGNVDASFPFPHHLTGSKSKRKKKIRTREIKKRWKNLKRQGKKEACRNRKTRSLDARAKRKEVENEI